MIRTIRNGIHLVYNIDHMYLFVHTRIVNRYFSSYGLEYMMTPAERNNLFYGQADRYKAYEIFKDTDCAVAFKELSCLNDVKKIVVSPDNLDNTLCRRYPVYAEWYNQLHPLNQIEEQAEWIDCYLEEHREQQNMIEKATEEYQPPFGVLACVPFDQAFSIFQCFLHELPWEYGKPLGGFHDMFYDLPLRIIKKRVWFATSYLLYGIQRSFQVVSPRVLSKQSIERGMMLFKQMLKLADYEKMPIYHDSEKYDFCSIKRLAKMLKTNKVHFSETA